MTDLLTPEPPQPAEAVFTDTTGRKWHLKLNVAAVRRLKAETGLDLFASADGSLFKQLGADPLQFCNVLWCLVADQAATRQIDEATFWEAIDDTALDAATMAFFEGLIAFFREDKRAPLRLILQKMKQAEAASLAQAKALAQSPKFDQLMTAMLTRQAKTAEQALDQAIAQQSAAAAGGA